MTAMNRKTRRRYGTMKLEPMPEAPPIPSRKPGRPPKRAPSSSLPVEEGACLRAAKRSRQWAQGSLTDAVDALAKDDCQSAFDAVFAARGWAALSPCTQPDAELEQRLKGQMDTVEHLFKAQCLRRK